MDEAQYRAHKALNYSRGKHLLKSGWHFQRTEGDEVDPTVDMEMGSMIHRLLLEGRPPDYVLQPLEAPDGSGPWHGGKSVCKAWKKEQEAAGKVILNSDQERRQIRMVENLQGNKTFQMFLEYADTKEFPIITSYRDVEAKAKLDFWFRDDDGQVWIGDLKKVVDASPAGFAKRCANAALRLQAQWYCNLLALHLGLDTLPQFVWICVEDSDAAPVEIYRHNDASALIGQSQMDLVFSRFKDCSTTGVWPSYTQGITDVQVNGWELKEI